MKPTQQVYSNYTEQDFQVWRILFERQMNQLHNVASQQYLDAIETVQFSADRIPDFAALKQLLAPLTGWSLKVVPNLCPEKEFFEFLSRKQFTATCWLRSMEQLDYLEEPDMFHDVFAHVPLLSNSDYVEFLQGLSEIALEHIEDAKAIELLGRIYWFTIEFGLIRENDQLKIYGAGILSSFGETKHALGDHTAKYNFNVKHIMHTPYRNDVMQDTYFVIESFEQLYHSLGDIRKELAIALAPANKVVIA